MSALLEPSRPLTCPDHGCHKTLGRLTRTGLYLYCKCCRQERLIPWSRVDWFRRQLGTADSDLLAYQRAETAAAAEGQR